MTHSPLGNDALKTQMIYEAWEYFFLELDPKETDYYFHCIKLSIQVINLNWNPIMLGNIQRDSKTVFVYDRLFSLDSLRSKGWCKRSIILLG